MQNEGSAQFEEW